MRRTSGAARARSRAGQYTLWQVAGNVCRLTLTRKILLVDGCADDHDIVDDRKAQLAANVVPIPILQSDVGQDGGLVCLDAALMELASGGGFVKGEEGPC